jgi:hypothetical protein
LGERLNGIQEVVGSIPIGSTKIYNKINDLNDTRAARTFKEKVIKSYKEKSTSRGAIQRSPAMRERCNNPENRQSSA